MEPQSSDSREGESPLFSIVNGPEGENTGVVTLQRGMFPKGEVFQYWYEGLKAESIARQEVVIRISGSGEGAIITWTLSIAWPSRVVVADPGWAA